VAAVWRASKLLRCRESGYSANRIHYWPYQGVKCHRNLHSCTSTPCPVYVWGESRFRFILTDAQTGGNYSVMEVVVPLSNGPRPHTHMDAEEHFLVLEGEADFTLDGAIMKAKAGDLVHIPRGTVHGFTVTASSATMIATFSPGGEQQALLSGSVLSE
jgi:quercetin dioxygenase-like cupin family protein